MAPPASHHVGASAWSCVDVAFACAAAGRLAECEAHTMGGASGDVRAHATVAMRFVSFGACTTVIVEWTVDSPFAFTVTRHVRPSALAFPAGSAERTFRPGAALCVTRNAFTSLVPRLRMVTVYSSVSPVRTSWRSLATAMLSCGGAAVAAPGT